MLHMLVDIDFCNYGIGTPLGMVSILHKNPIYDRNDECKREKFDILHVVLAYDFMLLVVSCRYMHF